jgi:hypothetical protein
MTTIDHVVPDAELEVRAVLGGGVCHLGGGRHGARRLTWRKGQ